MTRIPCNFDEFPSNLDSLIAKLGEHDTALDSSPDTGFVVSAALGDD